MKRTLHKSATGSRSLWRHRDLRLVMPARALSYVGDALALFALMLRIHDQGSGTAGMALLLAAFSLPPVLLMGAAGHISDRFDSRPVLLASTSVEMLACAGLALVDGLAATVVLVVLLQLGQAVSNPTWGALLPRIVGDEDMGRVSALQQGLLAATGVVGATAGGLLVGTWGASAALWVDASSFTGLLLAAALVRTRRGGRHAVAAPALAARTERARVRALDGLRLMRRDRLLWVTFVWMMPFVVVLEGVNVAEVFLVRDGLHASATAFGLVQAVFGVGAVLGAWLAGRAATDAARVRVLLLGFAGTALGVGAAGLAPSVVVVAVVFAMVGVANAAANAATGPLYAVRPPERERGKVLAAVAGVSRAGSVVAMGLGALGGSVLGPRGTFVLGGVLAVGVTVAMAVQLRGVDRAAPVHEAATVDASPTPVIDAVPDVGLAV
ncbi:MAG: MFS transporter [Oryzihumus sp.]